MNDRPPRDPNATGAYEAAASLPTERFAPGVVLAGRYRLVAALGKGGMGEVYRADDLTLGQPVALKFLPERLADDPDRLARFRKEVAAARRVSHPNCCRVYDLTESVESPFLSMEYIDGEDLADILRRFGRLPEEKALQIARELCAALAAVHDQGLLHRDLKPANVMLDGRGRVRLTDFGLAAAAEDLSATERRSGTPQYMAPEQLAGTAVSPRTDLFALGLVLYELFTGKKAFAGTDRDTPPSKPSSHVTGLDPAVERVILRCLEPQPRDRPASALAVAAALPGGDPLAAALAAGETPSPQLVADAPVAGSLRPAVALGLLAFTLLGIVAIAAVNGRLQVVQLFPPVLPPEELAAQARAVTRRLGYTDPPADSTGRVWTDYLALLDWQRRQPPRFPAPGELPVQPALMYYWHRESPARLVNRLSPSESPTQPSGVVWPFEPPVTQPGMTATFLDLTGRLIEFHAVPRPDPAGAKSAPGWWVPLFAAAGLDEARFRETRILARLPPAAFDDHRAWEGAAADAPDVPVRVEAAAYRGRPVYARVGPPGDDGPDRIASPWTALSDIAWEMDFIQGTIFGLAVTAGAVFAWRNLRLGRANRRGAARLAAYTLAATLLVWLWTARHTVAVRDELALLAVALGKGLILAGYFTLLYLAVEPAVRRRWPHRVVGWNRLLEGRLRDPLVGRDILLGGAVAVVCVLLHRLQFVAAAAAGFPALLAHLNLEVVNDQLGHLVLYLTFALLATLNMFFLFFVLARVLRREWAAALVMAALFAVPLLFADPLTWVAGLAITLVIAIVVGVIVKFGLLPLFFGNLFVCLLLNTPVTLNVRAWYGPAGLVFMLAAAALAAYGCIVSLGGQPLFRGGFFGDE